jgi:hypothetical protein
MTGKNSIKLTKFHKLPMAIRHRNSEIFENWTFNALFQFQLSLFQFHKKFSKFHFTGPSRGGGGGGGGGVKDTQIPGIVWSDANIPKLGGDPDTKYPKL